MYCQRLLFAKGKEILNHLSILEVYFYLKKKRSMMTHPSHPTLRRQGRCSLRVWGRLVKPCLKENQYFKKIFTSNFFSRRLNIFQSLLCNIIKMDWLGPGKGNFPSGASKPHCSTTHTHIHRHRDIHMHRHTHTQKHTCIHTQTCTHVCAHTHKTHTCACIHQCVLKTLFFSFLDFSLMYRPCTWHRVTWGHSPAHIYYTLCTHTLSHNPSSQSHKSLGPLDNFAPPLMSDKHTRFHHLCLQKTREVHMRDSIHCLSFWGGLDCL